MFYATTYQFLPHRPGDPEGFRQMKRIASIGFESRAIALMVVSADNAAYSRRGITSFLACVTVLTEGGEHIDAPDHERDDYYADEACLARLTGNEGAF